MNDAPDKTKKIGIFDSGIGGLTLLKELVVDYSAIEFYYVADTAGAPYGTKSAEEVILRAEKIVKLLLEKEVELIVVACNTATSLAIDHLRSFFEVSFVGIEPFVNAIHKYKFNFKKDKIAVLTTEAMFDSPRFKSLLERIDIESRLNLLKTPNLASIIESIYRDGLTEKLEKELEKELSFLIKGNFTHVVLGCTHYPLILDYFENKLGIKTISPCSYVSLQVGTYFDRASLLGQLFHYWQMETKHKKWEKIKKDTLIKACQYPVPSV